MEKESSGQRPVEANSTGGQGSRRAVADDDEIRHLISKHYFLQQAFIKLHSLMYVRRL
jgi:hypothetical protein